jgi:cell fate regulator YaaT (PSP1 superfamily)
MDANPYIVGVRFQKVGKLYHFDASAQRDLATGDFVVVETSRGKQLGQVIQIVPNPPSPPEGTWKAIQRKATPQDLVIRQTWQQKELEVTINCRAKASELKIKDVKFIHSEFSFDGGRLSIFYSNEGGEKMEFKELRRAMQRLYPQIQIEFHVLGPRDVAKVLGGMGACGLETRCCSLFLTEFSPISIKMAKEQGISLTPSEITGMCGRLRCCLVYEYEQYVEARKQLPKRGKQVGTPMGPGRVNDVYPLKGSVLVELEKGGISEFMRHEIQPWEEMEALKQKAEAPCAKQSEGGCDCTRREKTRKEKGRRNRRDRS